VGDPVPVGDLTDHEATAAQMTMLHASDPMWGAVFFSGRAWI
jgi:hypothetical protein